MKEISVSNVFGLVHEQRWLLVKMSTAKRGCKAPKRLYSIDTYTCTIIFFRIVQRNNRNFDADERKGYICTVLVP